MQWIGHSNRPVPAVHLQVLGILILMIPSWAVINDACMPLTHVSPEYKFRMSHLSRSVLSGELCLGRYNKSTILPEILKYTSTLIQVPGF